jgi:hypothetical protein
MFLRSTPTVFSKSRLTMVQEASESASITRGPIHARRPAMSFIQPQVFEAVVDIRVIATRSMSFCAMLIPAWKAAEKPTRSTAPISASADCRAVSVAAGIAASTTASASAWEQGPRAPPASRRGRAAAGP